MPTVCKISLDASEYRAELNKVISDTKAAKSEVTASGKSPTITPKVDLKPATQSVQQASGIVQKCSGFFKKLIPDNFGASVGKGATMIGAFGAASGASVPPVGLLAAAVNALLSPIALVTAAISALVALGSYVWDQCTESAEEYASKTAAAAEAAERHAEKVKEEDQAAAGYIARLQEIANAESVGNSAKIETLQLLDNLQSQYGDLGAVIDETTGKITNMAEVERRLNEARNNKKAGANYDTSEAYMREAKSAYMKVKGAEWFTTEKGAGKMFDQMRKKKSPEQLLREMEKLAAESNDADEIKGYQAVADKLRAAIKAKNKGDSVKNTGYESTEEYQKAMAEKSQAVSQAQAKNDNLDRSAARRKADNELSFIKDSDEKIKNRQGLIDEAKKRQSTIKSEVDSAQRDVDSAKTAEQKLDAQKRLLEAQARYKQSEAEIGDLEQQVKQIQFQQAEAKKKLFESAQHELQYNQLIIDGEYEKAAALKLEKELKDQNLKLTEEEKQKVLDQRKALEKQGTQKQINDAKDEVALNQLLIDGQYDLYEAEKLRLEMKRQGKQLTQQETEEILKQRKALASQKLQGNLQDQLKALQYKAMDAAGQGKEAARLKALDDAEKAKGFALTASEKDAVNKLTELQQKLSDVSSTKSDTGGGKILTNDLTRRGGFAGGAVMPSAQDQTRSINEKMSAVKDILTEIKRIQDGLQSTISTGLKV